MRSSAALILLVALPARAEPCRWDETGATPLRWIKSNLVVFGRALTCPGSAEGELTITMTARAAGKTKQFKQEKRTIRANGRWPHRVEVVEKGFGFCDVAKTGAKPRALVGAPGEQRAAAPVTIVAKVTGTGPLARLAWEGDTEALCPVCPSSRGSTVGFYDGRSRASRWTQKTRFRLELDADWFTCVRHEGSLDVRIFAADDDRELRKALRPIFVMRGLEKKLRKKGRQFVLEVPAPFAELCRRTSGGQNERLAWEVAGQGELARVGGGGRSTFTLRCK